MENSITIIRNINAKVKVTPTEIAEMFCGMDEHQQVEFFNAMAIDVKRWDSLFCFQLQHIIDLKKLTPDALKLMVEIGEYAQEARTNPIYQSPELLEAVKNG